MQSARKVGHMHGQRCPTWESICAMSLVPTSNWWTQVEEDNVADLTSKLRNCILCMADIINITFDALLMNTYLYNYQWWTVWIALLAFHKPLSCHRGWTKITRTSRHECNEMWEIHRDRRLHPYQRISWALLWAMLVGLLTCWRVSVCKLKRGP